MPEYEYQRFDGTQPFQPQSADELFDQFSEYLLEYGDQVLENLEDLAEELRHQRSRLGAPPGREIQRGSFTLFPASQKRFPRRYSVTVVEAGFRLLHGRMVQPLSRLALHAVPVLKYGQQTVANRVSQ